MRKTITVLGCCFFLAGGVCAQQIFQNRPPVVDHPLWTQLRGVMSHDPDFKRTSSLSFYKRKSEWRKIIDSAWGSGLPLSQKLSVFDTYANYVKAHNTTFVYTKLNWDSLSAYWRAKITDSTSRGGFSAILTYFAHQLHDEHSRACDAVMYTTPLNPGTPILVDVSADGVFLGGVSHFGAGLTVLPDSSLLVYMVTPNHPLGLEPGDIVLGYEGVPWKNLVRELIAAEIPSVLLTGTSPSAFEYFPLFCAGENWHLFDTIDVVKYKTGQTVHLPTDTLISLKPTTLLVNGAQIPVQGVPMPGWAWSGGHATSGAVTYGIVQGTDIGYIYVYHHMDPNVGAQFNAAVTALSQTHGLIIDIRFDFGGEYPLRDGIARLTSYAGPTLESLARTSPTDLWSLGPAQTLDFTIPQDFLTYGYPVAVLLGPTTVSFGDLTAKQLTYLDNVRFLGESPNGAYTGWWYAQPNVPGFDLNCANVITVDEHSPNIQLWGQEFPIDEHVLLTPNGVAKGEDDVVKRAIEWITTVTYAHNAAIDRTYAQPGVDTVCATAVLADPLHHGAVMSVAVTENLVAVGDTVLMYNDGLHGDGTAGDSVWGCYVPAPSNEGVFGVGMRIYDITQGTSRWDSHVAGFATAGPLTVDSIEVGAVGDGSYTIKPYVRNHGASFTVPAVSVSLSSADSAIAYIAPRTLRLNSDIAPGQTASPAGVSYVYPADQFPGHFNIKCELASNEYVYWTNTLHTIVTGIQEQKGLPIAYTLEQNYPNPFNPSTTIKYELPRASMVRLGVYDLLGREVCVLVNERRDAGIHEVKFDGSNLASGVYVYRLTAGDFVLSRKLLLLR